MPHIWGFVTLRCLLLSSASLFLFQPGNVYAFSFPNPSSEISRLRKLPASCGEKSTEKGGNGGKVHAPDRLMKVTGFRRQQLPVYIEPGDPYAEPVSHLRDGEIVIATETVDMAGQIWVRFTVDESRRGVYHGDRPKPPFIGWATAELRGHRWLLEVFPPEFTEPTNSGGRALSSFLRLPSKIPRCDC